MFPEEYKFSSALYTFDIGQNDLTAGYDLNMSTEQVKAYVPDVISEFITTIKVRMQVSSGCITGQNMKHFYKCLAQTFLFSL
ncbi:putative alpha-L-fucosidase [Helianthus annuus]|nr:putative alpha-L-fucosidase [Helianthus annuus]